MAQTKKRKKQKKKKQHRFFWFMIKLQIFLMVLTLGGLGYYYFGGYAETVQELQIEALRMVSESNEETFVPARTSLIYDLKGDLITELRGEKKAQYVKYEDIPAEFVSAMISIEDKKYYNHKGVDYKAFSVRQRRFFRTVRSVRVEVPLPCSWQEQFILIRANIGSVK